MCFRILVLDKHYVPVLFYGRERFGKRPTTEPQNLQKVPNTCHKFENRNPMVFQPQVFNDIYTTAPAPGTMPKGFPCAEQEAKREAKKARDENRKRQEATWSKK